MQNKSNSNDSKIKSDEALIFERYQENKPQKQPPNNIAVVSLCNKKI